MKPSVSRTEGPGFITIGGSVEVTVGPSTQRSVGAAKGSLQSFVDKVEAFDRVVSKGFQRLVVIEYQVGDTKEYFLILPSHMDFGIIESSKGLEYLLIARDMVADRDIPIAMRNIKAWMSAGPFVEAAKKG